MAEICCTIIEKLEQLVSIKSIYVVVSRSYNLFACFERGRDCWCWLCELVSSHSEEKPINPKVYKRLEVVSIQWSNAFISFLIFQISWGKDDKWLVYNHI